MAKIILEGITKRWGKFYAVDKLDLVIEDNSFITLLGPSGCGKTTILRMIAGLETPTEGKITIGDRVVFDSQAGINIPANKRKVGFLFQNYALWPNMTVYDNISFGLKNIKEEMPLYDVDAKIIDDKIKALKKLDDIIGIAKDNFTKDGKPDEDRILMKYIENFDISMSTAKSILKYDLHKDEQAKDRANKLIESLKAEFEKIKDNHKAKNEILGEKYEILVDGKVKKEVRKLTQEEIDIKVRRVAAVVKIGMFMDRYPSELSGGQQQRVAIARTLAPNPEVLFMDEPLSNLDAKLRLEMRYELQRLHVETGSTFVYVTHDQMEAMTLATKICLIDNGVLQQYAAPLTVYKEPANLFTADFVGNPSINFIHAKGKQNDDLSFSLEILNDNKLTFIGEKNFNLDEWKTLHEKQILEKKETELKKQDKKHIEKSNKDEKFNYHIARVNEVYPEKQEKIEACDYVIGIRPEFIHVSDQGHIPAIIYGSMPTGMETTLKVRVGEYLLTSVIFGKETFEIGEKSHISFIGDNIQLFDRLSGELLTTGRLDFN